ncbi:glutamine amidotransferase-related protein [Allitabrizicola rongguiensis]|uniref:glutamine amidotransferase-related protein n=1 Tax=Alitabrizicola rongguiensis TaxID=2909234 RepID=UPI001F3FE9DB|nr:glutamine amidotransferase [Tabrizicola rongguiensis]
MKRDLVLVRHGDDPPDDRVVTFAVENGFNPLIRKPFKGDVLGEPWPELAGTVIYGGPFNVFDEHLHPFLQDEARWIRACMDRGLPILGICQGAQQIARLLGAKVGPVPEGLHEFGYYPISATDQGRDFLPDTLHMVQAHFHTFDIPEGAVHLAASPLYPNQAFRVGDRVYGLQFHPEVTIEGFRRWQGRPWAAYGQPGAQTREEQDRLMMQHDAAQADWFYAFLRRLFGTGQPQERT